MQEVRFDIAFLLWMRYNRFVYTNEGSALQNDDVWEIW